MDNKIELKEKKIALLAIIIIMFTLVVLTGSLTSGYHLVDDHCLYDIVDEISSVGLLGALKSAILNDLGHRFRPLYMVEQVLGTAVFSTHMLLWNFYKLCQGIVTAFLLYIVARYLKLSVWWSALFSAIIILGPQFRCWNRAANQENTGAFLLAFALYSLIKSYLNERNKLVWRVLFYIASILMSLMKESFVIMIPALYLFEVCLLEEYELDGANVPLKSLFIPLIKHIWGWCVLAVCCMMEVYVIISYVGTNSIGYAGFSKDTKLSDYIDGIITSVTDQLKYGVILLVAALVLIVYLCYQYKISFEKMISKLLLFGYIFISQLALYAKSGMMERYLMPWVVSIAVIAVWGVGRLEEKAEGNFWVHDYKLALVIYVFIVAIISFNGSVSWTKEAPTGKEGFLSNVCNYSHEGDEIAIYGMDGEHLDSSVVWLNYRGMNAYNASEIDGADDRFNADTLLIKGDATEVISKYGYNLNDYYQYVWVNDDYSIWRPIE